LANNFLDVASAIRLLANNQSGAGCCDSPKVVVQNSIQNIIAQPGSGESIPVYGSVPGLAIPIGEFPPILEQHSPAAAIAAAFDPVAEEEAENQCAGYLSHPSAFCANILKSVIMREIDIHMEPIGQFFWFR
jgi:hypothetical protein